MYFILSRIIVIGLSSKSVMYNSEVFFGKKKKWNKEEDKLMNEKVYDEWEEVVFVYNLYNVGLCIF